MIGNHGYQVILDAYVKGISSFEVHQALEAMYDEVRPVPPASYIFAPFLVSLYDYKQLGVKTSCVLPLPNS